MVVVAGGRVVVVVVTGARVVVVDVVVVVTPPLMITVHPVVPVTAIGLAAVSKSVRIVSPMFVEPLAVGATLKVTFAMLTTPVGPVGLNCWNADIGVDPVVNVPMFVVGAGWNSAVLPPATDAIVTFAGSNVMVIP